MTLRTISILGTKTNKKKGNVDTFVQRPLLKIVWIQWKIIFSFENCWYLVNNSGVFLLWSSLILFEQNYYYSALYCDVTFLVIKSDSHLQISFSSLRIRAIILYFSLFFFRTYAKTWMYTWMSMRDIRDWWTSTTSWKLNHLDCWKVARNSRSVQTCSCLAWNNRANQKWINLGGSGWSIRGNPGQ